MAEDEVLMAKVGSDNVTEELFSVREMEVLRAKIEKRISLQARLDNEIEFNRKTYQGDEISQTGPSRLQMETNSRKTIMKILQDNK